MSKVDGVFSVISSVVRQFSRTEYGLPAQQEIVETQKLIGFSLLDTEYVVALSDISEVLDVPKCSKLPGVKPWVAGVANVRGRLLPIIDFADFLGYRLQGPVRAQRVLVFEIASTYVGLIVEQVFGMRSLPLSDYHLADENCPLARYIEGKFVDGAQSYDLFRPRRLVEDERFMNLSI